MNLFKPRRTFESVVRELVAGLEGGSIVLDKEDKTPQPENQNGAPRDQTVQADPHSAAATRRSGESPQR